MRFMASNAISIKNTYIYIPENKEHEKYSQDHNLWIDMESMFGTLFSVWILKFQIIILFFLHLQNKIKHFIFIQYTMSNNKCFQLNSLMMESNNNKYEKGLK